MRRMLILVSALVFAGCARTPPVTTVHGKTLEHWVSALSDKDAKTRRKAAEVLGNVGAVDSVVVPALAAALKDRDAKVRAEAVLSLLKIGPPAREAVAALSEARTDRDATVRGHVAKALERIEASGAR
jgi:HEAT repeat protein